MFELSQLSSPQLPAFTISAAGQEVWEGDIIQLNQLQLLDTLTGTESHCPFLPAPYVSLHQGWGTGISPVLASGL